jgi:hypothetical protein
MSGDETLYGGMNLMHTSVTSESSTLSGLATGPIPGQNLTSGSATGKSFLICNYLHVGLDSIELLNVVKRFFRVQLKPEMMRFIN